MERRDYGRRGEKGRSDRNEDTLSGVLPHLTDDTLVDGVGREHSRERRSCRKL